MLATGCLSNARMPDIKGLADFKGQVYHTGHWPHEPVDFTGLRVGVIGTGSSAIQSVPVIAEQASHLTVFQRTANFSIPAAQRAADGGGAGVVPRRTIRRSGACAREECATALYRKCRTAARSTTATTSAAPNTKRAGPAAALTFMAVYNNLALDKAANDTAADFVREKIAEIVKDPQTAKLLQPEQPSDRLQAHLRRHRLFRDLQPSATSRWSTSSPTRSRKSCRTAVRTGGRDYEVDALVLATGFDAMTGSVAKIDIRGRNGLTLNEKWAEGPRTYLGLMSAGFPNLFIITGPGSPSVLSNMIVSIEQHVDWIADCIAYMRDRGLDTMEATQEAEDKLGRARQRGRRTPRSIRRPIPGTWAPTFPASRGSSCPISAASDAYRQICNEVAAKGYEGFAMEAADARHERLRCPRELRVRRC